MLAQNGLIQLSSQYSVDETISRLQTASTAKGLKIFAVIDHSGEAEKSGLKMPATKDAKDTKNTLAIALSC